MLTYNPKNYTGEHFQEIFSEILFANNTVGKGLVRFIPNVKAETVVTSLGGEVSVQDYKVRLTEADSQGNLTIGDAIVRPVKRMVYVEFNYEDVRFSRFNKDMAAGAASLESDEYLSAVLGMMSPKISLGMEKTFWVQGIVPTLTASADVAKIAGVALTVDNLEDEFNKIYAAIPGELIDANEATIYADRSIKKLIRQSDLKKLYRDSFVKGEDADYFLDVKIAYVPLGANKVAAGRSTDFVWATDLVSDMGSIQVEKVQSNSDVMFIKSVFTMDSAVLVPTQKILYSAV